LSSVVCVGAVGDAQRSVGERAATQAWVLEQIAAVVAEVRENERILVETGDGAVVCFLGDPEDALFATTDLRARLLVGPPLQAAATRFAIGVNVGPIKVMKSPDGRLNPVGDGISNAQHVMGFAAPGQILVSRSFYEVIACLSNGYAQLFHYLGLKNDERVRELPVYEVMAAGGGADTTRVVNAAPSVPPNNAPSTEYLAYSTGWERAELTAAAIALEPYVGARARSIVKEAAESATSVAQLYRRLVDFIPEGPRRAEFCRANNVTGVDVGSGVSPTAATRAATPTAKALWPALLELAEAELKLILGPMARILVKKHALGNPPVEKFLASLAEELSAQHRHEFLQAMSKVRETS
jgi:hypothetical protein